MTRLINHAPTRPVALAQVPESALVEARQFLASTVAAVNPCTPATDLLGYVMAYRTRLSALVAAGSGQHGPI